MLVNSTRGQAPGFTLMEIMIAISILGLSMVVILDNISHSIRMYRTARQTLVATHAAQRMLNETALQIEEKSNSDEPIREDSDEGRFEEWPWLTYEREIEPAEVPAFAELELDDFLYRVSIRVSWMDGRQRSIELVHFVDEKGEFPSKP